MKCSLVCAVLLAGTSTALATDGFNFTFDTDAQGWTRGDLGSSFATIDVDSNGPAVWGSDSGNGFLAGEDHSSYAYHFSPDLGGGHGGLFGQLLEIDFQTSGAGGDFPFIVLMSSTDFLVKQQVHPASAGFLPYSYTLDVTGGWYLNGSPNMNGGTTLASDAQILAVLSDLRHIGISTDIAGGADSTRTDNVRAIPAPGALALLAVGGLLGARRRR